MDQEPILCRYVTKMLGSLPQTSYNLVESEHDLYQYTTWLAIIKAKCFILASADM